MEATAHRHDTARFASPASGDMAAQRIALCQRARGDPKMRQLGWLVAFVAALAAMWWAGLRGIAVLAALVCGLAGLAYLFVRTQRPALRPEQAEQDTRDVERDIPSRPT